MYLSISMSLHTSSHNVNLQSRLKMILLRPVWVPQQLEIESIGRKKKKKKIQPNSPKNSGPTKPQNYGYYYYSIKSTRIVHKPKGQG